MLQQSPEMRKYQYYEILEVSRTASREEINAAFRRLARAWHPDRNPGNGEAESAFRRINAAYQVLSNETARADYDRSPVECPKCGTHEVLSMSEVRWQCKHCGCRFDVSGAAELHAIDAPSAPPLKRTRFRAFQATQCSWCAHFYGGSISPCPYGSPRTNCDSFKPLSEAERKAYLSNPALPSITDAWLRPAAERRLIKKCTFCGALNPDPQRMNEPCWNCQRPIRLECPHCGMPTLFYDVEQGSWRCANEECAGKRFGFDTSASGWTVTGKQTSRPRTRGKPRSRVSTNPACPHCGAGLVYSDQQSMWCCVVCRNLYSPDEAGIPPPQDGPIPEYGPGRRRSQRPHRRARERVPYERRPTARVRPKREKTTGDYVLLAGAVGLIIIIGTVAILGLAGYLG